jgi:hypothetical protein
MNIFTYSSTFTILTVIDPSSVNVKFSQNQLLAMPIFLEICLALLLTADIKAWWCSVMPK